MTIVICPGVHPPELTQQFIQGLQAARLISPWLATAQHNGFLPPQAQPLIFPAAPGTAYSPLHVLNFLHQHCWLESELVLICFSAGVVAGIGATWGWQQLGGKIRALIAIDGWGVPLYGSFPIHRLSHDYFTHWSSGLLGAGSDCFYADPAVSHLELWRSPQAAQGWWVQPEHNQQTTAAAFLNLLLSRYGESV